MRLHWISCISNTNLQYEQHRREQSPHTHLHWIKMQSTMAVAVLLCRNVPPPKGNSSNASPRDTETKTTGGRIEKETTIKSIAVSRAFRNVHRCVLCIRLHSLAVIPLSDCIHSDHVRWTHRAFRRVLDRMACSCVDCSLSVTVPGATGMAMESPRTFGAVNFANSWRPSVVLSENELESGPKT